MMKMIRFLLFILFIYLFPNFLHFYQQLTHPFSSLSFLHFLSHYYFISFYSLNTSIYILQNLLNPPFLYPIPISSSISIYLSISIISSEFPLHFPFPQITLQIQNQLTNTSSISTNKSN